MNIIHVIICDHQPIIKTRRITLDIRLQEILNYYNGKVVSDNQITIYCPSPGHDDSNPSCQVKITNTNKISCTCYSQCANSPDPFNAIRSELPHLFPQMNRSIKKTDIEKYLSPLPPAFVDPPTAVPAKDSGMPTRYAYCDTSGHQTGLIVYRYINAKGTKDIMPCHSVLSKTGERGWAWSWPPKHQIYGLEQLAKPGAHQLPVLIVEGEKCARAAIAALGADYVVLAWSGGSNQWGNVRWGLLDWHPPEVILWPDKDEPGKKWSLLGSQKHDCLADILRDLGHKVRYVDPWDYPALPNDGHDIADILANDGDVLSMIAARKNPLEYKLAAIYDRCAVAKNGVMDGKAMAATTCGAQPGCDKCMFKESNLIMKPIDITLYLGTPFMLDWAYAEDTDKMYDLKCNRQLELKGYNNTFLWLTKTIGEGKELAAQIFLENPRTPRVRGKDFLPNASSLVKDDNGHLWVNRWDPAGLNESSNPEALEVWLELLNHLVPIEAEREHLLDWMAYSIQYPERKINHQIMFISKYQGVGKDTLFTPLASYFDSHSRNAFPHDFKDKFTGYLEDTKLLFIQEMENISKGNLETRLKPLAASMGDDTIVVERKGKDGYPIRNVVSIVAFSNKEMPMFLGDANDRRWFILKNHEQPLDAEYRGKSNIFRYLNDLYRAMNNPRSPILSPGNTAIIKMLGTRNVADFDAQGKAPMTKAKEEVANMAKPHTNEMTEMIADYVPPFHRDVILLDEAVEILYMQRPDMKRVRNLKRKLTDLDSVQAWRRDEESSGVCKVRVPVSHKQRAKGASFVRPYVIRHHEFWSSKSARAHVDEAYSPGNAPELRTTTEKPATDD